MLNKDPEIKVSICVVTYNHESYIADCLQSLIDQECDFDYEIIVCDDASTDKTSEILKEFQLKYENIKVYIHDENIGAVKNYYYAHGLAIGKYVCHMDGDDIAEFKKISIQSEFLDKNLNVNVCWHRMTIFNEKGIEKVHPQDNSFMLNKKVTRKDLILFGPYGAHSSTMYRKERFSKKYEFLPNALDWLLSVELIGDKSGVMLANVLGKYRLSFSGASSGAVANIKNRQALCACQKILINEYPEFRRYISIRALVLFFLDLFSLKMYSFYSLSVFLRSKSVPKFSEVTKLIEFYKSSKLPDEFK